MATTVCTLACHEFMGILEGPAHKPRHFFDTLAFFKTRVLTRACPFLINRERNLNPNFFFSNFSGASGIFRQNPGISRQKSLIPWVSRDIPNFLAPALSRGKPPPHQRISGLKSLGLGSFFVSVFKTGVFAHLRWELGGHSSEPRYLQR